MGILDDAIREHLELKRQHGAGSDDLDRLEKEAFGPPTRPGDPDFVDQEAGTTNGGEAAAAAPGEASPEPQPAADPSSGSTSDWLAGEDATTVLPQRESRAPEPSTEAARAEHPQLGDTADHPAPEGAAAEVASAPPESPAGQEPPALAEPPPLTEPLPPAESASPPEPPESSIFDADDIDFGDLDLDLEEEEDDGTVGPQPAGDESNPFVTEEEDPVAFEDEVPPTGESALPPVQEDVLRDRAVEEDTGNPPLPVPSREGDDADEDDESDDSQPAEEPAGEDLLGETPEFLRDRPEDDRAWFEQDPPKDFDFDD